MLGGVAREGGGRRPPAALSHYPVLDSLGGIASTPASGSSDRQRRKQNREGRAWVACQCRTADDDWGCSTLKKAAVVWAPHCSGALEAEGVHSARGCAWQWRI